MPDRPDPLAGLSARARRQREREDSEYLSRAPNVESYGTAEAIAVSNMVFAGNPALRGPLKPVSAAPRIDLVICARVDLDHPIYFPDNLFADCADCGCRLQYRPHAPHGDRVCICCGARRAREEGGDA